MREFECSVKSEQVMLKGTICLPNEEGTFPTVLMIHGSGALDRNENHKGFNLNIFNNIAHHLAEHGIASIRYDKRGCGKSSGDFHKTGHFELVDDVITWVDELKNYEFVNPKKIYLLGHSEGCIIAPQVNIKRKNIAGMVLLCPFFESMQSILKSQAKQVCVELLNDIKKSSGIKRIYKIAIFKLFGNPIYSTRKFINKIDGTTSDYFYRYFGKVPAKWFRELFTIVPLQIFNNISAPVLVIGGGKDIQCNPSDVNRIKEIAPVEVETHIMPELTHILRRDSGDASFSSYAFLAKNTLDKQMLDTLSQWLK